MRGISRRVESVGGCIWAYSIIFRLAFYSPKLVLFFGPIRTRHTAAASGAYLKTMDLIYLKNTHVIKLWQKTTNSFTNLVLCKCKIYLKRQKPKPTVGQKVLRSENEDVVEWSVWSGFSTADHMPIRPLLLLLLEGVPPKEEVWNGDAELLSNGFFVDEKYRSRLPASIATLSVSGSSGTKGLK